MAESLTDIQRLVVQMEVWAALGNQRLDRVAIPSEVTTVHIFADDDVPGHTAACRAEAHHRAMGREVAIRLPATGVNDWAAFAQARADSRPETVE